MLTARTLLALSLLTTLAIGCDGDEPGPQVESPDVSFTDEDTGPDDGDTDVETTDTDVFEGHGSLTLTLEGLPDDAEWPDIDLVGDTTLNIPEGGQLEEIPAGEYQLIADRVFRGLSTFDVAEQHIVIEVDRTVEATLSYELIPANWEVLIAGLPDGVDAEVTLEGPDLAEVLSDSTSFDALTPGAYLLTPQEVRHESASYRAGLRTAALASGSNEPTTITYTRIPGELRVQFNGLPDGVNPEVTVAGPSNYENTLSDETTLSDLVPGDYTLSAAEVTVGGQIFVAEPLTLTVQSDDTATASLTFEALPGELAITVSGLPAGVDANLVLTNPEGTETPLTQSGTLTEQTPGTYTLTAQDVIIGPAIYRAEGASVELMSEQLSTLTITYIKLPGELQISASGLPDGVTLSATLSGPTSATDSRPVTGEQTLEELAPGSYVLSFEQVTAGDLIFAPTPTTSEVVVASEQSVMASANYEVVPGTLTIHHEIADNGSIFGDDINVSLIGEQGSTQYVGLDGNGSTNVELLPGTYALNRAGTRGFDEFGNPYNIFGLDINFTVTSAQNVTVNVTAPLPTEVTRSDDEGPTSLREVLSRVVTGSVITFAEGLADVITESVITIDKEVSIVGPGADDLTLTTTGGERLFSFGANADVHLQGLRIADITTGSDGGAIHSQGVFSLRDMVFDNNEVNANSSGGAISINGATGDIHIEDARFSNNRAGFNGGALDIGLHTQHVYLDRVRFENNFAEVNGGAIRNTSPLTIVDARFANNSADANGGSIHQPFAPASELVIARALFTNNSAVGDGGTISSGMDAVLKNVTFFNNSAGGFGGAYYQADGDASLTHVTLAENSGPEGSALASYCDWSTSLTLKNSLVIGQGKLVNCSFSTNNPISSSGHNYIQTDSTDFIPDTTDQVGTMNAPLVNPLNPLATKGGFSQTMAVDTSFTALLSLPASSCTDVDGQPITEDQRRAVRPTLGFCTIGAYEATSIPETFDGHGLSTSTYINTTFTTAAGFVWDVRGGRAELNYGISGEGVMFRALGDYVRSVGLSGSVDRISVDYRKAFTSGAARQLAIAVNGTVVATSPIFGDVSGVDDSVFTLSADNINISGDFIIEIQNLSPNGGQIVIDNLSWR